MATKNCCKKTCQQENPQPVENFHKNKKAKDGLSYECKSCKNAREEKYREENREILRIRSKEQRIKNPGANREWRKKNPDRFRANQKRYKDKNRKEIRKKGLEYYHNNRERQLALSKKRRDENPEKEHKRCKKYRQENKGTINTKTARRRAAQLQRTPSWLTEEHLKQIKDVYNEAARLTKETGVAHEVDHVFPLQGDDISGLHVPWNLQILQKPVHVFKGNRLLEEDVEIHKKFVIDLINNKKPDSK